MYKVTNEAGFSVICLFPDAASAESKDQSKRIFFDGHLLNRGEIEGLLSLPRHSGKSDPELMLALYALQAEDCVKTAKGMYAFAVVDQHNGALFLARDRAGGKPLYYAKTRDSFIFAPDLKEILRGNMVPKQINKTALAQYLMLSYIPAPLSILENVQKLPAAHYMTLSAGGESRLQAYWDVVYSEEDKIRSYEDCKKQLRSTLFRAVEENLDGESSVGILLSGGIDSNIITGVAGAVSGRPMDTFSIGYKNVGKDYDESDRAILSAKHHNANHHLFFIEYQNMLDNIQKVLDNIDEPYADSSYLPTYTVSKIAAEHIGTVLTGDAGDELFAGYNKYLIGHYSDIYKKIPGVIRNGIIQPAVNILPADKAIVRKIRKVIDNSFEDTYTQRRNMMCLGVKPDHINKLLRYDGAQALDFIEGIYQKYEASACETDRTLYTDFKVVLEGDMLPKADRSSTLAGVVSKAPILHPDMVELAAKIPVEFKIQAKDRKIILKETFADFIPNQIVKAKKKGFSVPVANWFRNELREDLLATLDKDRIQAQNLLNADYVEYLVNEHISNRTNYGGILWALYVFEKWYQRYFEV